MAKYKEKDLSFYTEIELNKVNVEMTNRGRVISWEPINDVEGYAIYKGSGPMMKINNQRFIKIVVLSTHNQIQNKTGFYPTRENVAIDEIEIYINDGLTDYTDNLPVENFTASSSFNSETTAKEAFNNILWERTGQGWQSERLKQNPYNLDELHEWIAVDLGVLSKLDKIRIKNSSDSIGLCGIYEYRIDVSQDGIYWTPIHQGTLNRDSAFQDIDLKPYFYEKTKAEEDWELIETVGSSTTTYLDTLSTDNNIDYKVSGIVIGDISFESKEDGVIDLKTTQEYECVRQDITNRVRSQKGQWKYHQNLGSNLELLEGMKNTRETAQYGTDLITESLVSDGRIKNQDLIVRPVPKSITQVDYYIIATSDESNDPIVVVENIDM